MLQVISSSPGDLELVFATMLENAVRICDAKFGSVYRWDGDAFTSLQRIIYRPPSPKCASVHRFVPVRKALFGRMLATKTVVHVADLAAEPAYIEQRDPEYVAAVELGGVRTVLAVPMLKENELIGAFTFSAKKSVPSPTSRSRW